MGCRGLEPIPYPSSTEGLGLDPSFEAVQERLPTEAVITWLIEARNENIRSELIFAELQNAGWIEDETDWHEIDIDGDGVDDWIITLYIHPMSMNWGRPGDFLIISGEGLLYRFFSPEDYFCRQRCVSGFDFWQSAPKVLAYDDMTGDQIPELILERNICGAHTCTQFYFVLSHHYGRFENLVSLPTNRFEWGDMATLFYQDGFAQTITITYSEFQGLEDVNQDGLADLLVYGGWHGSAGSGIQRPRTETWSWNGKQIALSNVEWVESDFRLHILWEANDNYYFGNYSRARTLFLQSINDTTLKDNPYGNVETHCNSAVRFAAFRLLLISLLDGDIQQAKEWQTWLETNHPDVGITNATTILLDEFEQTQDLVLACEQTTIYLRAFDDGRLPVDNVRSTGTLWRGTGYAVPSLDTDDVCLIVGQPIE